MKLITCLIACVASVIAGEFRSQTAAPVSDPISGTWSGFGGRGMAATNPVTMHLKFDGKGGVSGTAVAANPGDITSGTFDPQTGAITLAVRVNSSTPTEAALEGVVVRDTITGRLRMDGQAGTFILTKTAAVPAAGGSQSAAGGGETTAALQHGFAEVSGWITKAADLVPPDKYTYQPVKTTRTFGQLLAHVVDGYTFYCGRAAGKQVEWSDATANGRTDKATVAAKLKQAAETCKATYANDGQVGQLLANVAHASLHYGNIITYMRLLGLVPPSSS